MATEAETLKEIQRLLANGETQAASDFAAAAQVEAQKAADDAAGKPSAPPPPACFGHRAAHRAPR